MNEKLTAFLPETAASSGAQSKGSGRAGVHAPVGYDAVYAEGASGPPWVVLGHGGEVCVILPFIFLHTSCSRLVRNITKNRLPKTCCFCWKLVR